MATLRSLSLELPEEELHAVVAIATARTMPTAAR
jgi:hypothetical protein